MAENEQSTNGDKRAQQARQNEHWTGVAFLPIGIVFFILGFTNSTYFAIGLPFLILAFVMMGSRTNPAEDNLAEEDETPDNDASPGKP